MESGEPIRVPQLCYPHLYHVVHGQGLTEDGPWQLTALTANLLLLRLFALRLVERAGASATNPLAQGTLKSAVEKEKCLACAVGELALRRVMRVLDKGLDHATAVVRNEIDDPDLTI